MEQRLNRSPSQIQNLILRTPILNEEHDKAISVLSMTGEYTVKSAYKLIICDRTQTAMQGIDDTNYWKILRTTKLHGQHALLLWRILANILPTMDRLQCFINLSYAKCYLCQCSTESIQHLILECQINKLLRWNSLWQIRISRLPQMDYKDWLQELMEGSSLIRLPDSEHSKLIHFQLVAFEIIWMNRNLIQRNQQMPAWNELSSTINRNFQKYWKAHLAKR